jgi:hypothetical protein
MSRRDPFAPSRRRLLAGRRLLTGRPRLQAALAAVIAAALGLAVAYPAATSIRSTEAAWIDGEVITGTLATLKVNPVTTAACRNASGELGLLNPSVPIQWTAPPATSDGIAPTSYIVTWSGNATTPGSAETTATSYGIPVSVLALGATGSATVTAKYNNWVSAPSAPRTFTITSLLIVTTYNCV